MSEQKIKNLKKKIFLTAYRFGAAHLSSAFSVIDFLYVLYGAGFVKIDKSDPWKPDRDRAILSKGHACLAQYVMLNDIGVISDEELAGFCQPGCHLGGEPKYRSLPGIEASTGSLGHGLSFAVGIAMAYKLSDYHGSIYVVIGDGECEEGSIWEAVMSIKRFELNNLILVLDDNKLQAMDSVKNLMGIASWREKFSSYGLHVIEIDGHNVDEIKMGLEAAEIGRAHV